LPGKVIPEGQGQSISLPGGDGPRTKQLTLHGKDGCMQFGIWSEGDVLHIPPDGPGIIRGSGIILCAGMEKIPLGLPGRRIEYFPTLFSPARKA
jgi:hypothetical protein